MKFLLERYFRTRDRIQAPRFLATIAWTFSAFFVLLLAALIWVPWQQTTSGEGQVIALDPNQRIQEIHTMVGGVVAKWFVQDGDQVSLGSPIVEVVDNDPRFLERLSKETEAKRKKAEVAEIAADTGKFNFDRQRELFNQGLSSRKDYEKAKIEYKKLLSDLAHAEAELASAEISLSRQHRRIVTAPAAGTVLRVRSGAGNITVKEGDTVAQFLPRTQNLAIEVFIDGNDFPLVEKGKPVRIQFEGWPAVQATGWPSLAIGTFEGVVRSVDASQVRKGRYRVIVVPGEQIQWPDPKYLRQGTRVQAWVILDQVALGYELWRRFNGFPLAVDHPDALGMPTAKKK